MKYDLNTMLQECIEECEKIGININTVDPYVKVNTRLKRPWARCCFNENYARYKYRIEFAPKTLTSTKPEEVRGTMMHEVLHAAKGAECEHHGGAWKRFADKVNKVYGYNIKRTGSYEEMGVDKAQEKYNYELYCPKCGYTWGYKSFCKAVKHPEYYSHKKCKTKLKSRCVDGKHEIVRPIWS